MNIENEKEGITVSDDSPNLVDHNSGHVKGSGHIKRGTLRSCKGTAANALKGLY